MKLSVLMVPLILAVAVSPLVVAAGQGDDTRPADGKSSSFSYIRGNPNHIRLAQANVAGAASTDAQPVAFSSFRGNPDRACARLAGHPPGRAQCRGLISRGGALMPMQAYSVSVPGFAGVIHYTSQPDGLRVVASLAEEGGAPLRIVSLLGPDTALVLSVPNGVGESSAEIEMRRKGDFLVIRDIGSVPAPTPEPEAVSEVAPQSIYAPGVKPTNSGPHQRPLASRGLD